MTTLAALLADPSEAPARLSAALDAMTPNARRAAAFALDRRAQASLFERVAGAGARTLADLVPDAVGPDEETVHAGRNSLPAFTRFAKVFARRRDEVFGYNRTGPLLEALVGPGYFTVVPAPTPGELLIDYGRIPAEGAPGWPAPRPNDRGPSRLVYGGLTDVLRRVSEHVSIGRAFRAGRAMDNWFVLVRDDARAGGHP